FAARFEQSQASDGARSSVMPAVPYPYVAASFDYRWTTAGHMVHQSRLYELPRPGPWLESPWAQNFYALAGTHENRSGKTQTEAAHRMPQLRVRVLRAPVHASRPGSVAR